MLCKGPMAHATAVRFWHSAADTTMQNFIIYHLTFVDGLASEERAAWLALSGFNVVVMEVLLTPAWAWLWSERSARLLGKRVPSMQHVCMVCHLLGALVLPLLLRMLPLMGLPRPWEARATQRFARRPTQSSVVDVRRVWA